MWREGGYHTDAVAVLLAIGVTLVEIISTALIVRGVL